MRATDNVSVFPGILRPGQPANAQPQQDIIEKLESLLDRAQSGQLQALAFAGISDTGNTFDGWCGGAYVTSLMGAIAFLEQRFAQSANATNTPGWSPDETDG